jgi:hypothetical protein
MLSLVLASSLWLAASEAGARVDSQMRPVLSSTYCGYSAPCDPEPTGDGLLSPGCIPDCYDVFVSELGEPVGLAPYRSPLCDHVSRIVGITPNEDMARVNASPDIAPVEGSHPWRDGTILHLPRKTVGEPHSTLNPEMSVTVMSEDSGPKPAFVRTRLNDLRPESFWSLSFSEPDETPVRAKGLSALAMSERLAAGFTNDGRLSSSHDDLLVVDWLGTRAGSKPSRAPDHTLLSTALYAIQSDESRPVLISPVELIADRFASDVAWLIGSHSLDLFSTAWALHRCLDCREGNAFGPTSEARIALKMAGAASTGLTLWKLRRSGKHKAASVLLWVSVAVNAGLTINNTIHAVRRK